LNNKLIYYILVGAIVVAVFLTVVLVLRNVSNTGSHPVTLQFWGVFDDRNAFDKVIKDFKTANPNIDVKYQQFTYEQYEQGFVNALAAGTGPDILMIHNTWLPKYGNLLAPLPADIPDKKNPFTIQSFKDQYVDNAYQDLVYNNQMYGIPLYSDTLALYYNKDLFNSAGITRPPQTWDEVNHDVQLLTKLDGKGNITQSGFALGTARNINRSTDILMDMMIQSGVQMTSSDNRSATFTAPVAGQRVGELALQYYTNFANVRNQDYTWNDSQHYSVDAFTEGTLGMMTGYAHQSQVVRSKAPRLNFAVAPMPQASLGDIRNFANYWSVAVPAKSAHQAEAWKFLVYLGSKEGSTTYLNATARPAARRDLIDLQRTDPDLGVFAVQALTAKSWFQIDNTAIEGIFADMIDDVNFNRSTLPDALSRAESRVTVLMQH
jgi:multiple sugar transport system substrate-binding protein